MIATRPVDDGVLMRGQRSNTQNDLLSSLPASLPLYLSQEGLCMLVCTSVSTDLGFE